ncbi:MAG TPA: cyclohexa-1,5-dienecarbonyl-CoA hydratase [Planctomycetes bacterium]|nr:cyclohexa-1,5-dienecarbonyl-CoA hydratase [Planctomycetota bacterium]
MAATEAHKLRLERLSLADGACTVARIVLDAGKGNVIDLAAIGELRAAVGEIRGDRPHAILIDHEGSHFSFGASVDDHRPETAPTMLADLHAMAREILDLDVPVLASVRGMCLGGGLELALLADRIFAAPGAQFGQPEIVLGVFAPIGSALLPRVIGARRAADLLVSGRRIDAETALDWGLVGEIADDPSAAMMTWAQEHLGNKSRSSLRFATRAARATWQDAFCSDLAALEARYVGELMETHDAREGIEAFLEKRKPTWEDR